MQVGHTKTDAPKSLLISKMSSSWSSSVTIHLCHLNSGTKPDLFVKEQDWKGYYTCIHHARNPYFTSQIHVNVLLPWGGGACYRSRQRLYFEKHELKKKKATEVTKWLLSRASPVSKAIPMFKKREEGGLRTVFRQTGQKICVCLPSISVGSCNAN